MTMAAPLTFHNGDNISKWHMGINLYHVENILVMVTLKDIVILEAPLWDRKTSLRITAP